MFFSFDLSITIKWVHPFGRIQCAVCTREWRTMAPREMGSFLCSQWDAVKLFRKARVRLSFDNILARRCGNKSDLSVFDSTGSKEWRRCKDFTLDLESFEILDQFRSFWEVLGKLKIIRDFFGRGFWKNLILKRPQVVETRPILRIGYVLIKAKTK